MATRRGSVAQENHGSLAVSGLFDNLPRLLRPDKAAALLGISVKTIYDWRYRGGLRRVPKYLFLKINRTLYLRTDMLAEWIASQNPAATCGMKEDIDVSA